MPGVTEQCDTDTCCEEMSKLEAESGAQLLVRISSQQRPSLEHLCNDIFPDNGPFAGRVVEITGETNTGKSHFIMEMMARAILPTAYGGREASVLFFNLDNKFKIQRFLHILEKIACASNPSCDESTTKQAIEDCLHSLLVFSCFTTDDYEYAQFKSEDMLASNPKISLVTVDSVSAFYWLDCKEKKPLKMETYMKRALQGFQKLCQEHKLVVAYTRPSYFAVNTDKLPTTDESSPDYRIRLISHDTEGVRGFEAEVDARGQPSTTYYTIDNFGVKFLNLGLD